MTALLIGTSEGANIQIRYQIAEANYIRNRRKRGLPYNPKSVKDVARMRKAITRTKAIKEFWKPILEATRMREKHD